MNVAAIEYIWKAIQESERSDELQFMDDERLITAAAHGLAQSQPDQSGVVSGKSIVETTISSKPANNDSLQAITPPPLSRP